MAGVSSLKEKRSIIKSLLARLQNTFHVSTAEVGFQDVWQDAAIAFCVVTNSTHHANQVVHTIVAWIEPNYPDVEIVDQVIEIL